MICYYLVFFFFFKQKTAYELRISDWSSDVCSSDLFDLPARIADVVQIIAYLGGDAPRAGGIAAADLGETGDAGAHQVPVRIVGNVVAIDHGMGIIIGARADQAHVAPQDVPELGQFVDAKPAQQAAQPGDPLAFDTVIGAAVDAVCLGHRAELVGGERLAVHAHAFLPEEQATGIEERVQDGDDHRDHGDEWKRDQRAADVHRPLRCPDNLGPANAFFVNLRLRLDLAVHQPIEIGSQIVRRQSGGPDIDGAMQTPNKIGRTHV